MLKKKRTWLVLVMALVAAGLVYVFTTANLTTAQSSDESPQVQTATVRQGDIIISASGAGNLMPAIQLDLGFHSGGTLVELLVKVGDEVQAGDVLARLDDTSASQQVAQAQIDLETAQINLEDAQTTAAGANDADELTSVRINLKQVTDALADAQTNYDAVFDPARDWELNDPRWADRLKAERDAAARALDKAKDNLAVAQSQYNLAVTSLADSAAQSESSLRSAQLSVDQAQLSLESAQQALADMVLTAPIAGTVSAVSADVGEAVGTTSIITLIDMSQPLVRFWIEEGDLDKAVIGNKVTVVFEALRGVLSSQNPAQAEIDVLLKQIESGMTANQIAAIRDMRLTQSALVEWAQSNGLNLGGAFGPGGGQGGGFSDLRATVQAGGEIPPELQATMEARRAQGGDGFGGFSPEAQATFQAGGGFSPEARATLQAQGGPGGFRGGGASLAIIDAIIELLTSRANS